MGIWGRRLEEVAPDQILSPLRSLFSVATLLPRTAFVHSGTIPRTDFSCSDAGSEHPKVCYLYAVTGVLSKTQERSQLNGSMPARAKGKDCARGRTWSRRPGWGLHIPI